MVLERVKWLSRRTCEEIWCLESPPMIFLQLAWRTPKEPRFASGNIIDMLAQVATKPGNGVLS